MPQGLRWNVKLFVNNTLIFSTITSPAVLSSNLNEDLLKTTQWAYQWKMSLNLDITKHAAENISSRKKNDTSLPSLYFTNA